MFEQEGSHMSKKRKQYSREFKIQVIREIESGTPVAQVARQNEIHESLIHKWKKQYSADPQNAFSGPGRASTNEAKIAELERSIGKLYLENEFLKKTLDHFEMALQRGRQLS
jgi:transposase